MANTINFDDARRRLDRALEQIDAPAGDHAPPELPAEGSSGPDDPAATETPPASLPPGTVSAQLAPASSRPAQTTTALARLVVGVAVLSLDALAARSPVWEQRAGIGRGEPGAGGAEAEIRDVGEARFRHGLIGWIFETEEELRPSGNPLQWLRKVVGHLFGSVFSVVFDSLPRLGPRRRREAAPGTDQDTARWVARGQREEPRSRAFAIAALDDIVDQAIPYLARQRGVQQAVAELVRSPVMDDAIIALARREGVQQAVAELVRSPAIDDAVTAIVRSPAMEGAVTHIVGTQAMQDAIETLSRSPALVQLVQTQSTSIAGEILEDVRERGVSGDLALEGLVRRVLGRRPRSALPPDAQGLIVSEPGRRR